MPRVSIKKNKLSDILSNDNAFEILLSPPTHSTLPPAKRPRLSTPLPPVVAPPAPDISQDLGTYIARDVKLFRELGWKGLVEQRRQQGDWNNDVGNIKHPAGRLLDHYKRHGAPVKFHTKPWTRARVEAALKRGPHRSCHEHVQFLHEEFIDMIQKSQWIILPYEIAKDLPGIRLSPPGVIPQRDRRARWIGDYSFYCVNEDTLPLAPKDSMQFGHALDRYLRELLLADPKLGPVEQLKIDIGDGFYRCNVSIPDIPKLGLVFPVADDEEKLVAFPLVLPMGWVNSPPIFCAATETAADLANASIKAGDIAAEHPLDTLAATMDAPPLDPKTVRDACPNTASMDAPPISLPKSNIAQFLSTCTIPRDPSLPEGGSYAAYIDVFVDDFIALCQGEFNKKQVRRKLLQAIDQIFRPCDSSDSPFRTEPVSIKKLMKGDVSWSTIKTVLGWVINTTTMTIHLPEHRIARLAEILASIPATQKRLSLKKWHKVLGELRSMSLALPGSRNIFSQMQKALSNCKKTRVCLTKGVHQALNDFRWMLNDITVRPTRIAELVPLLSSALGYHDASGDGAGGVWYPHESLNPRAKPTDVPSTAPIVWRYQWPQDIIDSLVTDKNPSGTITNSDLELAGGLLHLEAISQEFDVRERTILSKTDNLATLFWQRKGSATTTEAPAFLLRLFGIHQRFHRYVPRHDYISGISNPLADAASRLFNMSDSQFISYFNSTFSKNISFRHVQISSPMLSAVTSALRKKTCSMESLLVVPPAPIPIGASGRTSQLKWASTPFSKPSRIKYQSYKSSDDEFVLENLQQGKIQSSLDRLKITYGQLDRRSSTWGSKTQG